MAYDKHEWQSNELMTAEKLNNIEEGIANIDDVKLDKTFGNNSVISYTGNEKVPLRSIDDNVYTDLNSLSNFFGMNTGQQTSLVNYVVEINNITSLPWEITDSNITSSMTVLEYVLSNPAAKIGDWTITTNNAKLIISGSISGATDLTLVLGESLSVAPTIQTNLSSNNAVNLLSENPRPGVTGVLSREFGGTGVEATTKDDLLYKIGMTDKIDSVKNALNTFTPVLEWRNGSLFNPANNQSICMNDLWDVRGIDYIDVLVKINLPEGYDTYGFEFSTYRTYSGTSYSNKSNFLRKEIYYTSKDGIFRVYLLNGENGFAFTLWATNENLTLGDLKIEDVDLSKIGVIGVRRNKFSEETIILNNNARHIIPSPDPNVQTPAPLTLLHFSDIHGDTEALKRIIAESNNYDYDIDGIICTGDMTLNSYGEIAAWWNPNIMTVIGNHDTASYSEGSYNWTALNMSDRYRYYISPFVNNWGVVYEADKSYYYKDYASKKVRLIVLDVMLYNNPGQDSEAQNAWLDAAMTGAKNKNYHVLIACHTSAGGSIRVNCSFSGLDWPEMPALSDCNLPDSVLNIVTEQINSGCVFIGYICGHFHQDMIWEKNGQYMYQVTCANTNWPQWRESDQSRGPAENAYNLFTVDTLHGTVKIVRCGGADYDMYMRKRKAICFDYINHRILGEIQ